MVPLKTQLMATPPVVLLSIDSLRADYVGTLDESVDLTPNIDGLAADSILFERAYAQGCGTRRSMAALMTSTYPNMYGGISRISRPTLAEALANTGYHTIAAHSNPYLSRYYGYDRGFNTFHESILPDGLSPDGSTLRNLLTRVVRVLDRTPYTPAGDINDWVTSELERMARSQFFLWIHYMDPHGPYQQSRKYLEKYRSERLWQRAIGEEVELPSDDHERLVGRYRTEVERTDEAVGEILRYLRKHNLYDEAFVVLCSDHGEGFGEHGFYGHPAEMYEEVLRVPLLIKPPGGAGGKRIDTPVGLLHVASTLVAELDVSEPETFLGSNLLAEPRVPNESGIVTEAYVDEESKIAITQEWEDGFWRFVWDEVHDGHALYDLCQDPVERTNRINDEPAVRGHYQSLAEQHIQMVRRNQHEYGQNEEPRIPNSMQRQLKGLGYLE